MIIAVGDVHGCADELRVLLNKLPLTPDTTIVFLGDYVDRGPASAAVIDTLLELSSRVNVVALMGNHEAMFLDYLRAPGSSRAGLFIYNGGSSTLASYADEHGEVQVPAAHREFLGSLRLFHETEHYFFVHAGLPSIPLDRLDIERHRSTMLWTRGRFLQTNYDWGKVVVHGHTPVDNVTIRPNRVNIDTGVVFNRRLTALALPGERQFSVRRLGTPRRVVLRDPAGRREAYRFVGEVPVNVLHRGRACPFVTVDYSELGMLLRALEPDLAAGLEEGERIEGVIGPAELSPVAFAGIVARRRSTDRGLHVGVRIVESKPVDPVGRHEE